MLEKDQALAPCLVSFISPFRLVLDGKRDVWKIDIEQVNKSTYDAVKLHRSITSIKYGDDPLEFAHICFDGAIAIPALPLYKDIRIAVAAFNRILCNFLLGGVYCEAVEPSDIVFGKLYPDFYIKCFTHGQSLKSRVGTGLRERGAGDLETIKLYNPPIVEPIDLHRASYTGDSISKHIPNVSKEFIISSCSAFSHGRYGECLSLGWTTIEQILSLLWETSVLKDQEGKAKISKSRKDFLKDYRTWTSSAKIEMLRRLNILSDEICFNLDIARKARNDFVHDGELPDATICLATLNGIFDLLMTASNGGAQNFDKQRVLKAVSVQHDHNLKMFVPVDKSTKQVPNRIDEKDIQFWREIVLLPGMVGYNGPPADKLVDWAKSEFEAELKQVTRHEDDLDENSNRLLVPVLSSPAGSP